MSWQARAWADDVIRRAGPLGKARAAREAVLRNLADRHNEAQMPYPRVITIARDTGHGERKVQRVLRFWERFGALRVAHRGGRKSSVYWLQLDWLPPARTVTSAAEPSPLQQAEPSPLASENRHPEPSKEESTKTDKPSESNSSLVPDPAAREFIETLADGIGETAPIWLKGVVLGKLDGELVLLTKGLLSADRLRGQYGHLLRQASRVVGLEVPPRVVARGVHWGDALEVSSRRSGV